MGDDIVQVKSKTNEVFDAVLNANSSKIDDFVLVTFSDPETKLRIITRDRNEFKRALDSIVIINGAGGDCPEYAMSGIELALEKSKPNSFFYVFTDASAKDHNKFERIKSLSQKKSIQVTFLLTGKCGRSSDTDYVVYDKIAEATSGQVFHIEKDDINKIINYIIASIKHKQTTLSESSFDSGYENKISFTVDSKVWDVIVSISAEKQQFDIIDPDGTVIETEIVAQTVTSTHKNDIRKIKTKPGVYTINLKSTGRTSVIVTGFTSICFEHGFSATEPVSLNDTSTMPLPGFKSYLSIALDNDKRDVVLKTVEIRDLKNNIIKELPVTLINEDKQFYTSDPFDPPTETFRIAINGFTNTGEKITRVSSTPVQPQKPELEEMVSKMSPTVIILSDDTIEVKHGESITLKCKLNGFPEPDVTWEDMSGTIWPSKEVPVDLPYDYMSVLTIDRVTKSLSITCKASNSEGYDAKSVNIVIKPYLNIIEYPKDVVIEYGASAEMKLIIDAFPPATIIWYKNDNKVTINDNFNISSDSSILTIKNMHLKLQGKYSVKVANEKEEKTISFKVKISGIEKPKIDKNVTDYFVKVGSDVDLYCRLLQGKPKPTLSWYITDRSKEQKKINESGETIHIDNLKKDDSRTYICVARNEIGKDYHVINLNVHYPPSIEVNIKNYNAKENEQIKLVCKVDGFPLPRIRWFKNGSEISSDSKYRTYHDNILRFSASIEDIGVYTCEASNFLGIAQEDINLNINAPIQVKSPKETVLNIQVGSSLVLPCVADGYPLPEIKWTFTDFESKILPRKLRADENNSIAIPRVQLEDEGFYICNVRNFAELAHVAYEVHVLAPPVIHNKLLEKTLNPVNGDLVLRIPCQADGRPKPTVSWTVDELNIALGTEWYDADENGTLIIKNVNEKSSGTYKCKAENSLGSDSEEFYVTVQPYPRNNGVTIKELYEEGTKANIKCDQPHNERDVVRWFKNGMLIKIGELTIPEIKISDSGLYSCRVSNFISSHSTHKMILVGHKPQFYTNEETDIEFYEGAVTVLECSASGYPTPTVTWLHNGHRIEETSNTYTLQMKTEDIGNYTCIVSNDFGNISRIYNVINEDCSIDIENDFTLDQPLIMNASTLRPIFKITGGLIRMLKNELILITCPESSILYDKFNIGKEKILVSCAGNQMFTISGRYVDFNDIKCKKQITPLAKATGKKCNTGNTELLLVGFSLRHQFEDVYEVCFDKDKNVTIYAKNNIDRFLANKLPKGPIKYVGSKYLPPNVNDIYECRDRCCFAKRLLVNPRDVSLGFPQVATYNDLNVSPQWSTCGTENWDEVERRVRSLVEFVDYSLIVLTGAYYEDIITSYRTYGSMYEDRPAPRYIWKVIINLQEEEALAIIQVNIPNLRATEASSHVLCADICDEIEWMINPEWRNVEKGFTYCCRLQDFTKAFDYDYIFKDYVGFTNVLRPKLLTEHSLT
ncbi:unnamed protein product [Euphydryas editha]|uniref:Ig-like domain-containing protein n=1 Tax=Euphydryas editha TaxID=104508 RepID=A0AAU9TLF3_EUPED|nr:unnamed protein product [Euphydryas editha]